MTTADDSLLRAGTGRVDITPPPGIAHLNWGARTHDVAEGVHLPLWLTVLLLEQDGHQAGDDCLRLVGQAILRAGGRPGDTAARYGGDEFAVILPDTDGYGAVDAAERVRAAVKALAAGQGSSPLKPVTVSVGEATAWPADSTSETELVRLADEMLYRAKREGRDRVCLHPARKVGQQAAEAA